MTNWATCALVVLAASAAGCGRVITPQALSPPIAAAGPDLEVAVLADVGFDGGASTDEDGELVDYAWTFGDGASAAGVTATHAYQAPGAYVVMLAVTDDDGATGVDTAIVTVSPAAPTASFIFTPTAPRVGDAVSFDGTASAGPVAIAALDWRFGDGATAQGDTASHTYARPGTFTARLTVSDEDGAVGSVEQVVNVAARDAAGTYDLTSSSFSCARYQASFPDAVLTLSQQGTAVTATGDDERTYSGTLEGAVVTLAGAVSLTTGGSCSQAPVDVTLRLTVDDDGLVGMGTGFFDLGASGCQCSARWDITGVRR